MKKLLVLVFIVAFVCITGINSYSQDQSYIETRISDFIRKICNENEDLKIKFGTIPSPLKGRPNVKNINFTKVPDSKGDGVCLVEVENKNNRDRSFYVPFRIIRKTNIFILTQSGKRSDMLKPESVTAKETLLNEKKPGYPTRLDEIVGRTLKKDVTAGTVITYSKLDDPVAIHKGEIVDVVAENKKLMVRTKGRAMEKGKIGDSIRVKNVLSEKEIFGKVVDNNTILVKF
jgi:flagella basal body P-ring formation protein FlgA